MVPQNMQQTFRKAAELSSFCGIEVPNYSFLFPENDQPASKGDAFVEKKKSIRVQHYCIVMRQPRMNRNRNNRVGRHDVIVRRRELENRQGVGLSY